MIPPLHVTVQHHLNKNSHTNVKNLNKRGRFYLYQHQVLPSLGNPTEIYFYGTQITIALLGAIPATFVINRILLPTFYNLNLVSLNEVREIALKNTPRIKAVFTSLDCWNYIYKFKKQRNYDICFSYIKTDVYDYDL